MPNAIHKEQLIPYLLPKLIAREGKDPQAL